jgi:UPF0755 protein
LAVVAVLLHREMTIPSSSKTGRVLFEIAPGENVRSIARKLQAEGVIARGRAFLVGYRIYHSGKKLKAGEYELFLPASVREVLLTLIAGKVYLHSLTIPEGLTVREIADLVREESFPMKGSFQEACGNPGPIAAWDSKARDLEGYLFPDTYHFPKGVPARAAAESMVAQFKKVFGEDNLKRAAELRMTVRDIVTIASLIEKETSVAAERALVSAVFHNRLKLGMKLDCDPTVIYALKQDGLYRGRLLTKDLKYASPYNTYVSPGIPPGPICNPGRDSIAAALRPAANDFIYFVARGDGSHQFSRSLSEHLRAVAKFRLKKK